MINKILEKSPRLLGKLSQNSTLLTQLSGQLKGLGERDMKDLTCFFEANEQHNALYARYFPASTLSDGEKLQRTANAVGFNLPKMFDSSEEALDINDPANSTTATPPTNKP